MVSYSGALWYEDIYTHNIRQILSNYDRDQIYHNVDNKFSTKIINGGYYPSGTYPQHISLGQKIRFVLICGQFTSFYYNVVQIFATGSYTNTNAPAYLTDDGFVVQPPTDRNNTSLTQSQTYEYLAIV